MALDEGYRQLDAAAAADSSKVGPLVLTLHRVIDVIDRGEFVARSHPVEMPPGINAIEMHRITWPQMGGFIRYAVLEILDGETVSDDNVDSWTMHETPTAASKQAKETLRNDSGLAVIVANLA